MENIRSITYEYIRGLIEGEGSFTFSTNYSIGRKIPAFELRMHVRDKEMIENIRDILKLKNNVYVYHYPAGNRGPQAMLIVREFGSLKNVIIPLCYKKLKGNKGIQFSAWLEKIENDPMVPKLYKFLYKFHVWGHFDVWSEKFR
jgi:hypothetical protein